VASTGALLGNYASSTDEAMIRSGGNPYCGSVRAAHYKGGFVAVKRMAREMILHLGGGAFSGGSRPVKEHFQLLDLN